MVEEKHYEIVKSGGKEYVYEVKADPFLCDTKVLKEVRTVKRD